MKRIVYLTLCAGVAWSIVASDIGRTQEEAQAELEQEHQSRYAAAREAFETGRAVAEEFARQLQSNSDEQAELELLQARELASLTSRRDRSEQSKALIALRGAKSDEEREKARTEVRRLLGEEFDRMIKAEEQSLASLEARLAKLREQVVRRREAKSKLVDLRLETLENEIQGLGWPGGRTSENWRFGGRDFWPEGMTPGLPLPTLRALSPPAMAPPAPPLDTEPVQ